MNPDWILKHFDQISESPDAAPRLRRFILDLAVRGKLAEQDPKDEPAAELLKKIEGENVPFGIPKNWVSARAGKLLNFQYGKALPAKDRHDQGSVPVFGSNGIVGYCEAALAEEPAIIIGRKGSAGALNLCDDPSWTTDVAYFLIPPAFFNIRFLFVALQTLDLGRLGKGVKPGLSRTEAYQLPIVVPPLTEQHRIVAKVDELMALCDELEAAQQKRERRRDRLVAATLHGLNNGDASSEASTRLACEESARFYFNHLPRLTTRPEHIQQLRQTILNLAVRGKLVPQGPADEPASELLGRIAMEREQLTKAGTLKNQKPFLPVPDADLPFQLPKGWSWSRLHDVFLSITDGDHQPPPKAEDGVPFLVIGNVRNRSVDFAGCRYVTESYYAALDSIRRPLKGDILYTLVGSYGIPVLLRGDSPFCVQRHIGILRPSKHVNAGFMARALETDFVFGQATICATGIAQKTVPLAGLRNILIPLPPLAEQERIVAKVDELMRLCGELESRIESTAITRRQLLEATLGEAIAS